MTKRLSGIAHTLSVAALVLSSMSLEARPYFLKISTADGAKRWEYSRGDNNAWVYEVRAQDVKPSKRPLAKHINHERLFGDIRRAFVLHQSTPRKKPCAGHQVRVELGGLLASRHKNLCLTSMVDKALLGRLHERLSEAEGGSRTPRPLFGK